MRKIVFNIKELGPIHDSNVVLNDLMVLSGESGLGKSYVAFLIHYFYYLLTSQRLKKFFDEKYNIKCRDVFKNRKPDDILLEFKLSELIEWINKDSILYLRYILGYEELIGNVSIEIPLDFDTFTFKYDEQISGLKDHEEVYYLLKLRKFVYNISASSIPENSDPFVIILRAVLADSIIGDYKKLEKTFLMPPSRGSLIDLNDRPAFPSGMYHEFFNDKISLNLPIYETVEIDDILLKCLNEINVGDISQKDGKVVYFTEDGHDMPISAAASSIKELAPLTLLLKKYSTSSLSLLFEEPEAHLHPKRQVKVADLVGCLVNLNCHMQITTHSDYFIKRLNNLMELYKVRINNPKEYEVIKNKWSINDEYVINPDRVGAYIIVKNRQTGYSNIVKQDIDNGIPFESFYQVIEDDLNLSRELRRLK